MTVDAKKLRRIYEYVKENPDRFAEKVLGIDLWERQIEMLHAVRKYQRSATRSGHKIGKSATIAAAALWIVSVFPGARVVCSSASGRQVKGVIWRDLKKWYRNAAERGMPLGGQLSDSPDTGLRFSDGREIVGFSTDAAEKIAGYSGPNLFFLFDEASGIGEAIFEAVEGNRAGGARLHCWSNPTKTTGYFFERFTSARAAMEEGSLINVSSEEVAHAVAEGRAPGGVGLATLGWVTEKRAEWGGPGSPLFDVRVRGEFPSQSATAVVGLSLLTEARARWDDRIVEDEEGNFLRLEPEPDRGVLRVGIDPARTGEDESALAMRRGMRILRPVDTARIHDGHKLARWAIELIQSEEKHDDREVVIGVDANGIGASCFDLLAGYAKEKKTTWTVNAVNTAEAVPEDFENERGIKAREVYANLRSFAHFMTAAWLKDGGELPPDPKLEAEALAPSFKYNLRNRLLVEPKDEIRKRLKRSPDRFDSVILAIYEPPAAARVVDDPQSQYQGDDEDEEAIGNGWRSGRAT